MNEGDELDVARLYRQLDDIRRKRGVTWGTLGAEAGINASTFSRMAAGRGPSVGGLMAMLRWSGMDANVVLGTTPTDGADTLGRIHVALRDDVRIDPAHAELIESVVRDLYVRLSKQGHTDRNEDEVRQDQR